MTQRIYVEQDGRCFAVWARSNAADLDEQPIETILAPKGMVKHDYDCEGAAKARDWFTARAAAKGFLPIFSTEPDATVYS